MNKYQAKWVYGQQCGKNAGKIKAECEAATIEEFADKLCGVYGNYINDDYSLNEYNSHEEILAHYGEEPEWLQEVKEYPIYVFVSSFGTAVLNNPSHKELCNHILWGESYGDYNIESDGVE